MVDEGYGAGVEVDDLGGVFIGADHAVAADHDGADDGVAGLAGLFAEGSGELHHAHEGASGDLGGLLVGEVGVGSGG